MSKEELIKELGAMKKRNDGSFSHNLSYTMKRWELELVADFILERDKKIVEPLVKYKKGKAWGNTFICEAIDQTLKNARVE